MSNTIIRLAFRFALFFLFSCFSSTGSGSVRRRPSLRRRSRRTGVRHDGYVGAAAVLHLRLLDVRHAHPHRHLRRDQHRHVLLPALRRGLPLVRTVN